MATKKTTTGKATKATTLPLHEAYAKVLRTPEIWKRLKWSRQTVNNYRVKLGKDDYPSDRTMRKVLAQAGWHMAVEEIWTDDPKAALKKRAKRKKG